MVKEIGPTLFWCGCFVLFMVGCALPSGPKPQPHPEFCAEARPILVSPLDKLTTDTAHQILEHDKNGARLCGWKR